MNSRTLSEHTRIVACTAVVALMAGCREHHTAPAPEPPEVQVVTISQRDVPIYREWVGTLAGEINATIAAQVTGYLLSRNYTEGSTVTNGQILFQIDPRPFEAALAQAKAKLEQAKASRDKYALDVERYRPLAATEAISKQELDDAIQNERSAEGQVQAAAAEVQQAELNLGFATIRSPIDGRAGLASVAAAQIGNLIGPNSGPLTTVEKLDPVRVYFSVSERMMTEMQERLIAQGRTLDASEGLPLAVVLSTGQVYPIKGLVRFKNNQVDAKTGTVTFVGEFTNPQRLLLPGMFVRVRAQLDTQKGALVVPQRAVADLQGRSLIAVVGSDNKVSIVPVTVGERFGQEWVISGEVKAGERVVAEGLQKIRNGEVVNPVPYVPAAPVTKAGAGKE